MKYIYTTMNHNPGREENRKIEWRKQKIVMRPCAKKKCKYIFYCE